MRPTVDSEEIEEVHSKFLIEGKVTLQFKKLVATYTHSKDAIATTSVTTPLHTMFHCMGVKGKKV